MNIGILTFHRADNYGALLQAYALQRKLSDKGYNVEIIDYRCAAIEQDYIYKTVPPIQKKILTWCKDLARNLYVVTKKKTKAKRCSTFRDEYLRISKVCQSKEDRIDVQNKYDLIITGSDQIWSIKLTNGKDDWYCFKKEIDKGTVAAYGASVGSLKEFSDNIEIFKKDLNNYGMISTREGETKDYLCDALNREVFKVLDPTLLIPESIWVDMTVKSKLKPKCNFIFYYDVERNAESERIAIDISKKTGYKLIHFDGSFKMLLLGGYAQEAGPIEFLWLIRSARYVVTSSFHATVFSIIFEKNFCVIPHPKTGARVRNLLSDLQLNNHIVESFNEYSYNGLPNETNFTMAKDILRAKRKESEGYIDRCISKAGITT